jgi:hypothetical protein
MEYPSLAGAQPQVNNRVVINTKKLTHLIFFILLIIKNTLGRSNKLDDFMFML